MHIVILMEQCPGRRGRRGAGFSHRMSRSSARSSSAFDLFAADDPGKHSGNIQEHSVRVEVDACEHSGNIQGTFRGDSGNIQEQFGESSGSRANKRSGNVSKRSNRDQKTSLLETKQTSSSKFGNLAIYEDCYPATLRVRRTYGEHAGNVQGTSR
jgi:hypothetical protein